MQKRLLKGIINKIACNKTTQPTGESIPVGC